MLITPATSAVTTPRHATVPLDPFAGLATTQFDAPVGSEPPLEGGGVNCAERQNDKTTSRSVALITLYYRAYYSEMTMTLSNCDPEAASTYSEPSGAIAGRVAL